MGRLLHPASEMTGRSPPQPAGYGPLPRTGLCASAYKQAHPNRRDADPLRQGSRDPAGDPLFQLRKHLPVAAVDDLPVVGEGSYVFEVMLMAADRLRSISSASCSGQNSWSRKVLKLRP